MKNIAITLLTLIFSVSIGFSQVIPDTTITTQQPSAGKEKKDTPPNKDQFSLSKIYFGGSVGFTFGSYFRLAVYPMIAYKFTPKLSAGIEVGYEFVSDNRYTSNYKYSNYGFSVLARYRLIPQLYFHVEPAMVNYKVGYNTNDESRKWIKFLFVGGGYSQKIGRNTWAFAQVKFDVLHDSDYYHKWTPFWNAGISVGF